MYSSIRFSTTFMLFNYVHIFLKFRLSGFQLPSSVVSTGSILTLWFTTDFAVSAQGFKALYEGRMLTVPYAHPRSRCAHPGHSALRTVMQTEVGLVV